MNNKTARIKYSVSMWNLVRITRDINQDYKRTINLFIQLK